MRANGRGSKIEVDPALPPSIYRAYLGNSPLLTDPYFSPIGGVVAGTPGGTSTTDHFGFSAQQIGSFKAGGYTAPLTPGPANNIIELSPVTGDVTIREVA